MAKRYENESSAENRCGMIVDYTCDDNGEPDEEIECGATAQWTDGHVLACSDCYAAHDTSDRARFSWLDPWPERGAAKDATGCDV